MLTPILVVFLVLILLGSLPLWPYSRGWGYSGSGIIGFVLLIVILGLLFGWL